VPDRETLIPAARHESSDIGERFIGGIIASSGALLLACGLLAFWLYPNSRLDTSLNLPLRQYPEPRLQPDPTADMRAFYAQEMRRLSSAGWMDASHHTGHIPIEQAMSDVAREGIAGWPYEQSPP
jgi:hypothetical protein